MAVNEEVTMMMSVVPGAMTGISTMMSGLVSINNVFLDMTRQIDATFGLVDSSIITAGTVVAQFGIQAAEAFGEFEQGMKIVQMVSNQTAQDMEALKQKANEFSVSYRTDIDQITEGLQTLGRAGLNSASEQTEVLQNGLSTAKLESRDLNSVLEELIQNTALLGGNLKSTSFGEDSGYINDLLVATSMTAPITTHDVSETLKYSGGIAAAAGARIDTEEGKALLEDYMGAIAAFAQKGVTGSIAGTALRAFMNKPATQDSSVVDALASLHLKPEYLWEDGEEQMKPISEQIALIKNQMDELNVSTMDQLQIWSKIVGGKMGQQMMKLESEDIKNITKDIRAADDAQSKAAGTFQTFQSNMKEMTEQGQVAFREFGQRVTFILNPMIDLITKFLEILSNPVSATLLFGGFVALIGTAASKISNVFRKIKEEFAMFKQAFHDNEKLLAMRPSYERYHGRTGKGDIHEYIKRTEERDPAKAFEKDFAQQVIDKKLSYGRKHGFTPEMYALYDKASKMDDNKYLINKGDFLDSDSAKQLSLIFTSNKGQLGIGDNQKLTFGFLIKELMDNNLWKEEWSNALYNPQNPMTMLEFQKQFQDAMIDVLLSSTKYKDFNIPAKKIVDYDNTEQAIRKREAELIKLFTPIKQEESPDELRDKLDSKGTNYILGANPTKEAEEIKKYFQRQEHGVLKYKYSNEDLLAIREILQIKNKNKKYLYDYERDQYPVDEYEDPEGRIYGDNDPYDLRAVSLRTGRLRYDKNKKRYVPMDSYEDYKDYDYASAEDYRQMGAVHKVIDDLETALGTKMVDALGTYKVIPNPERMAESLFLSPAEVRELYRRETGQEFWNVKDNDIKEALNILRMEVFGTPENFERQKKVYEKKQTGRIFAESDKFEDDYFKDRLRGYKEIDGLHPTDSDYYKRNAGLREYFKETLFHKMISGEEMSDDELSQFVFFDSPKVLRHTGQFMSRKTKKPIGYTIPKEFITAKYINPKTDEEEYLNPALDEFFDRTLLDNGQTLRAALGKNVTKSQLRRYYDDFITNILPEMRENYEALMGLAMLLNDGVDFSNTKYNPNSSTLFKSSFEKSNNRDQLKQLGRALGLELSSDMSAEDMKKKIGGVFSKSSPSELLNKIDFDKLDEKQEGESKKYQNANLKLIADIIGADIGGLKSNNDIRNVILGKLQSDADAENFYKKFGHNLTSYDDEAYVAFIEEGKRAEEEKKKRPAIDPEDYADHMLKNEWAGMTPAAMMNYLFSLPLSDFLKAKDYFYGMDFNSRKSNFEKGWQESINNIPGDKDLWFLHPDAHSGGLPAIQGAVAFLEARQDEADRRFKERQDNDKYVMDQLGYLFDADDPEHLTYISDGIVDLNKEKDKLAIQQRQLEQSRRSQGLDPVTGDRLGTLAEQKEARQIEKALLRKKEREPLIDLYRRLDEDEKDERDKYKDKLTREKALSQKNLYEGLMSLPAVSEEQAEAQMKYQMDKSTKFFNISNPFAGAGEKISNILFKERPGRLIGSASNATRIGKIANLTGNLVDLAGGPIMVAMEIISGAIQIIQQMQEEYNQEIKDIKSDIKDAYSSRQEAENNLKSIYREQNPDAEPEAAGDYVLEQYGAMYDSLRKNNNNFDKWIEMTAYKSNLPKKYELDSEQDDGSMKEVEEEEKSSEEALTEAINKNNAALYQATAELQLATNKFAVKTQDTVWGLDGLSSNFSDNMGLLQDTFFGLTSGSGSIENGFLLTASQKDENYAGATDLSGLMLEDFYDTYRKEGDSKKGLKRIFGSDFDTIMSSMPDSGKKAFESMANFSRSLGRSKNIRLQSSMMNDKKSWQQLAKEMAKYEKKTGKHAMTQETENKRMENLIKKLQIDTHLNRAQVIAAAQLQQLEDMYAVAEQTFVPLMSDQAATAASLYNTTAEGVLPQTGNAAGGAISTAQNAAAIAAYLSVMAQNAAVEAAYNQDLMDGKTNATTKEQYLQEAAPSVVDLRYKNKHGDLIGPYFTWGGDLEKQKKIAHALEYQGDRIRNSEWTDKQVSDYSKRIDNLLDQGVSFSDAMKMARENYTQAVAPLVEAAYLSSGVGESDSGSGGSGSGSGSGNKDKDQGTRKERVDLVLCNKKEIPKLNVNLFKKAPSFTILNKNFKLRDIKVNTQDKPKAVLASIKNAIIDVQKRTDPKIIQDEEAIYDPVGATDGNTPSGTSDVRTNTG